MATTFAVVLSLILILLACLAAARLLRKRARAENRKAADKPELKETFVVKPYLQLGNNPGRSDKESMELTWWTSDEGHLWAVEVKRAGSDRWSGAELPVEDRIKIQGMKPKRRLRVKLTHLPPGARFDYRVLRNGSPVFQSQATAPKTAAQPYRFVAVGDLTNGRPGSKNIAYQISLIQPDLLVIPGDITYKRGRISEYRENFFPAYNSDFSHFLQGGPVVRSVLAVASLGNHDAGTPELTDIRDLNVFPDLLGYFLFWSQPLNGPLGSVGATNTPDLIGLEQRKKDFLAAAGERFPRMANYSFDYGNAHWLVLDANNYMDWTSPELRAWVENDLASAKNAVWKFVAFHQGGFTSDVKHADEQRMRLLADIFERTGVDVVFNGHNHAYERNYPLRFKVKPQPDGKLISPEGRVDGEITLDKKFDGQSNTRPEGILYIVTGGGGGKLNLEVDRRAHPDRLPPFTYKLVDDRHSFTLCDVNGRTLTVRQIAENGEELDRFVVTK
ncbi:MAG TPA: metallophosphoesterase [Candidatus Obscuribacterales bacterium]